MPNKTDQTACLCCKREVALTFHHLIPKKMHRRTFFKKHYNKTTLNEGIFICRQCHNGIHSLYTEMQLAKQFNTYEQLVADPALSKHFEWVAKQAYRKK